jgi:hypothetical protein
MSRRTAERHSRRIEVRFWRHGHDQPHSGFTIDLSKTGMFLGTSMALEPGERLRIEAVDRDRGFVVEGQVARVHRVATALRHVQQPGVGVRFLGPGELVANLLNVAKPAAAAAARPAVVGSAPAAAPIAPAPPAPAPAAAPPPPAVRPAPPRVPERDSLEDLFGPNPDAESASATTPAATAPAPPLAPPSPSVARTVPVEFASRDGFLAVYGRDIAAGGLFVTTDTPAGLHEVVQIDLRPPIHAGKRFCFEARVVQRFDPQSGGGKPGLTGMGVQFLDPDRVRAALAPIVAELRG